MMLDEEDWAAVMLRSRCPYKDTMRSWAKTVSVRKIFRRSWRIARQAPQTPQGRRRHRTSAPWPGRRRRALRDPPWPRSCSAAPSWCRWPWAGAPESPRPPRSALCGPWSSWPEILTMMTQHRHSTINKLHWIIWIYTGHTASLTVFVNQLSYKDNTQGMSHDYPVIVVSPRMTWGVVTVHQCYILLHVHPCDARYSWISGLMVFFARCWCLCPVLVSLSLSVPGAPSVTRPGQARKSPAAWRAETSANKCGPGHGTLIVSSHSKEMARRMWNGDDAIIIFYPTQLSNTGWWWSLLLPVLYRWSGAWWWPWGRGSSAWSAGWPGWGWCRPLSAAAPAWPRPSARSRRPLSGSRPCTGRSIAAVWTSRAGRPAPGRRTSWSGCYPPQTGQIWKKW